MRVKLFRIQEKKEKGIYWLHRNIISSKRWLFHRPKNTILFHNPILISFERGWWPFYLRPLGDIPRLTLETRRPLTYHFRYLSCKTFCPQSGSALNSPPGFSYIKLLFGKFGGSKVAHFSQCLDFFMFMKRGNLSYAPHLSLRASAVAPWPLDHVQEFPMRRR